MDKSFLSFAEIDIFIFLLIIVVFLRVSRARTKPCAARGLDFNHFKSRVPRASWRGEWRTQFVSFFLLFSLKTAFALLLGEQCFVLPVLSEAIAI